MAHRYYSQRTGTNPNLSGLPLEDIIDLFVRVFDQLQEDGCFSEAFGFTCVDADHIAGKVRDVELEMLLTVKKKSLWPIESHKHEYSEDDFFDVVEFLYQHVSKPIDGTYHHHNGCGMHWETFNQAEGRGAYRDRINAVLSNYEKRFELSPVGEVLRKPEEGFEPIFEADIPSKDSNVVSRIDAAVLRYRRHGSSIDDRRQAVRDLADVLEYLRPKVRSLLTASDDKDLFNIANNFGVRHHNDKQKTTYDAGLWLSWMFYFYLATIHVVLRKIEHERAK
jgi:hypothetical protein